jgi:hypothetical protein
MQQMRRAVAEKNGIHIWYFKDLLNHRARLYDTSLKRQRREWLSFAGASGLCRIIAHDDLDEIASAHQDRTAYFTDDTVRTNQLFAKASKSWSQEKGRL